MKRLVNLVLLFVIFISCEKPSDCIESSGNTVIKNIPVQAFKRIKVYRGIEVIINQGTDYKMVIEAGENFIGNIDVNQNGDQLIIKDNTSCNWVRDYGQTKIYVTTPTLEEIYSKTDRNISSNGILSFPSLVITSVDKDADGQSGAGTGDFHLQLNNSSLVINNNNVSRYFLSGSCENAQFNLYAGDGRIEAQNLMIQNLTVFHRGSNDMIVNPIQSITGKMVSTGDIILKNVPPIVSVQQLFNGHLIYP